MVEEILSGEELVTCPNCHTANHPGAVVCVVCGIRLDTYEQINQQWEKKQQMQLEKSLENWQDSEYLINKSKLSYYKNHLSKQILFIILTTILVVPVVFGILFLIRYQQERKFARLSTEYKQGVECYNNEDFYCAKNTFNNIILEEPDFQDSQSFLIKSRLGLVVDYKNKGLLSQALIELNDLSKEIPGDPRVLIELKDVHLKLAEQYLNSNDYESSISELNAIIQITPGDQTTEALISKTYQDWYKYAVSHKDWFRAWWIKQQLKERNILIPR